jgi:transcriptional regulator with PAS, ATPase and Fis domain
VLLGKTRFPAVLYQTYRGTYSEVDLPFDITVDVVPELLRDTDRSLQSLASRAPGEVEGFQDIVGQSSAIRLAVGRAERTAIRDLNVLLLGESGTGKELFARSIHRASHRGKRDTKFSKFVAVNCAAIPPELFESELFGHLSGSFSGARDSRAGRFEAADGGTLFLDEVGECSLDNQAKLLRVLQPRRGDKPCTCWVTRVGENEERPFNVRVVAATNRLLLENVSSRDFRSDLYYRLATVSVQLPPLRDRKADIEPIANDILARINREFEHTGEPGYRYKKLTASAVKRLKEHHWPGNVRELTNVLYQAAVMQREVDISRTDIEAAIPRMASASAADPFSRQRGGAFSLKARMSQIERAFVEDAMEDAGGSQTRAAELLKLSQQALSKKLLKWDSE